MEFGRFLEIHSSKMPVRTRSDKISFRKTQGNAMITVDEERMAEFFCKYHLRGLPNAAVLHHFGSADAPDAHPHSHPWGFRSIIIHGGYVERVFQLDGSSELIHRKVGDSFEIAASHIHRIEELPEGECWSLILPGAHEQTSGFYDFRPDGAYQRRWNEQEWSRVCPAS